MSNPGPATTTTAHYLGQGTSSDGQIIGDTAASAIGFYGATPIPQRTNAAQVAVSAAVGAAAANGVLVDVTATPTQTAINNNFATVAASLAEFRTALVTLGLIKGS